MRTCFASFIKAEVPHSAIFCLSLQVRTKSLLRGQPGFVRCSRTCAVEPRGHLNILSVVPKFCNKASEPSLPSEWVRLSVQNTEPRPLGNGVAPLPFSS